MSAQSESWAVEPGETSGTSVEGVREVNVEVLAGTIDIIGHDQPHAQLDVTDVEGKSVEVSLRSGVLQVKQKKPGRFRGKSEAPSAVVSVLVPRDVVVSAGMASGPLLVTGVNGKISASNVSGPIHLDDLTGEVSVNTVSGTVQGTRVNGRAKINGVSGDVTLEGQLSELKVNSVSGSALVDISGALEQAAFNAVSGGFTVRLDADLGAEIRASSVSGSATLDGNAIPRDGRGFTREGNGPAKITLNTVSGSVKLISRV